MEETMAEKNKGIVFFTAVIFCFCLLAGAAHFFYQHRYMPVIQLGSFFLAGCLYAAVMQKKTGKGKGAISFALVIAIGFVVALSIFYFFKKAFHFADLLSITACFLLPNVVMEAWRLYSSILSQPKQLWAYSKDIPTEPLFVYLENKPLQVQLLLDDNKPLHISSVAPLTLSLGMALFYILKKEVEVNSGDWRKLFIKENGHSYRWLFYSTSYGFIKTYFKPEENLFENNIRSNTVIIAKRIA